VPDHLRSKLENKVIHCIFVGYDPRRKRWICCNPNISRCYISRKIIFDEMLSWWSSQAKKLQQLEEILEELKEMLKE
jgi:hypothetical protein